MRERMNFTERNRITNEEAFSLLNIRPLKADVKEIFFRCPNCGNPNGKLKCSLNREKSVYHCFQCGDSGNLIDLYMKETGFAGDKHEAIVQMHRDLDGNRTLDIQSKKLFQAPNGDLRAKEAVKALPKDLDRAYRILLSMLTLKSEHKADLLRRGLTQEEIETGLFASMPMDREAICRKLMHTGCDLYGIPGFFTNRYGQWELMGRPGYCCPVFQEGLIVGIQIRMDKAIDGRKYTWLSSPNQEDGCSSGSPCTYFGDKNAKEVIVTEGILKSYIVHAILGREDIAVIGVPGVNNIKDCLRILQDHNTGTIRHTLVYECFDMDKRQPVHTEKDEVKRQMLEDAFAKLTGKIKAMHIAVHPCTWDMDENGLWKGNFKGIDDYLAATRR